METFSSLILKLNRLIIKFNLYYWLLIFDSFFILKQIVLNTYNLFNFHNLITLNEIKFFGLKIILIELKLQPLCIFY
jgi:hypothetical protein